MITEKRLTGKYLAFQALIKKGKSADIIVKRAHKLVDEIVDFLGVKNGSPCADRCYSKQVLNLIADLYSRHF